MVVAASVSDNAGGIAALDAAAPKSKRLSLIWADAGFKRAFADHARRTHKITVDVVHRDPDQRGFHVLPRRWVVERTWAWTVNSRRLRIDDERDPVVTEGFVWASHSRLLLRRLTQPAPA